MNTPSTHQAIELRAAMSGPRYYLAGRALHGGDILQLCFSGGWVTGRYEWDQGQGGRPRFSCSIELEGGGVATHSLEIPERALFRWPPRQEPVPPR